MDYVPPGELLGSAVSVASKKAGLSVSDMLVRGFLAGAILSYATSLVLSFGRGCPLHVWAFDLSTGNVVNHPESQACVATYPIVSRME